MQSNIHETLLKKLLSGDFLGAEKELDTLSRKCEKNKGLTATLTLVRAQMSLMQGDQVSALRLLTQVESSSVVLQPEAVIIQQKLRERLGLESDFSKLQNIRTEETLASLKSHFKGVGKNDAKSKSWMDEIAPNLSTFLHNSIQLQLGWRELNQGNLEAGMTIFGTLIPQIEDPGELSIAQLMVSVGMEKAGRMDEAIVACDRSRMAAVQAREPNLYMLSATSLCRLYQRVNEKPKAVLVAYRAQKSLEMLGENDMASGFSTMLEHWKNEWSTEEWNTAVQGLKQ